MNKEQVIKILKVCIIATAIMLGFEVLFSFDVITNWFGNLVVNAGGWAYAVIWAIMFLQVTILNVPAYVILSASVSIGINTLGWQYILTTISAYMAGCLLAYWLGWKFGKRAVKWCAGSEEDYEKWCSVLNKKGKLWYLLTVLFPFFPDDLLCLVAGSVKFNFWFYTIANLIGRTIGLITMLYTLKLIGMVGGGFPFMIIVWGVALIGELVVYMILKRKGKIKNFDATITDYGDYDVWKYTVYWRERGFCDEWKRKFFAKKEDAKDFAKRHKNKTKPYPYITQTVTTRTAFRKDVECERVNIDFKYLTERTCYRKIIKY